MSNQPQSMCEILNEKPPFIYCGKHPGLAEHYSMTHAFLYDCSTRPTCDNYIQIPNLLQDEHPLLYVHIDETDKCEKFIETTDSAGTPPYFKKIDGTYQCPDPTEGNVTRRMNYDEMKSIVSYYNKAYTPGMYHG